MTALANERIAYHNGEYLPESRRRCCRSATAASSTATACSTPTRTFGHRLFRLEPSMSTGSTAPCATSASIRACRRREMCAITEEVLARNLHLLGPHRRLLGVAAGQPRGSAAIDGEEPVQTGPTVIVECTPLPLRERATLYRDGIRVVVPAHRRTPPEALSPRAKTNNYLEHDRGRPGGGRTRPRCLGGAARHAGQSRRGPRQQHVPGPGWRAAHAARALAVLPGISRQTVIEIAAELGIPCREADLDSYDAYAADEAFLTSTSLCICPVRSINGMRVGGEEVFGPVTQRLIRRYSQLVDCDFVDQYRRHLTAIASWTVGAGR